MELTIHGKQLALEPNQHIETMDVRDFVESFDYDIDKLYIDRFWDSTRRNTISRC
jgi:sulfur relay (sulfurtransferase) DsrF/TusC family protein